MAPSGRTALGKVSPAPAAPTSRPYATAGAELNRPYVPGESAAEQKQAAEGWRWILLAALGLAAIVGYTKVWPAAQQFLYRPSVARDYLLPPSPDPLYVIAGVGVGWFWILFIAAPVLAAVLAALWWAMLSWSNHRARTGHMGHVRPGQHWTGEQYPTVPLILAGAAVLLATAGALLRWASRSAAHLPGRLLMVALLAVAVFGLRAVRPVGLRPWADHPTAQQGHFPGLAGAGLAGSAGRAGAGAAMRSSARPSAFPKVVKLLYGQHPRSGR